MSARPPFVTRPHVFQPATDPARILRTVADGALRLSTDAANLNVWSSPGEADFLAGQADALRRELLRLAGVLRGERKTTKREGPPNAA
jgi:hypothetical protein